MSESDYELCSLCGEMKIDCYCDEAMDEQEQFETALEDEENE